MRVLVNTGTSSRFDVRCRTVNSTLNGINVMLSQRQHASYKHCFLFRQTCYDGQGSLFFFNNLLATLTADHFAGGIHLKLRAMIDHFYCLFFLFNCFFLST